ncbi:pyruvate dehydrogenase (acetyl-transferring), homodimeric type [Rickettsiella grylli]|uniref:Pyruvate dehydrogenase E1 component n=1 Tax=Rickettsiella grylli TaxID=59196 RepID=A8PLX0_9COXI|nr:pyruvate dehydrogenase (acetyl-transferring), homodimeric type [Rickettsiella grylli]EDP46205.1 pyruvate dehydrogenase (acetyl-transferring), homodimeric type [Rickettsiella grylli]
MTQQTPYRDKDPIETQEWIAALLSVLKCEGADRAQFLIQQLVNKARQRGCELTIGMNTPYVNTIPPEREPVFPGNEKLERRIAALIRWNAVMMVLQAGKVSSELGGHIATYASAATLYEVGFNHFFHAENAHHGGDLVYIQGHSSPGIYARAFLEGRLSKKQLTYFRQEIGGQGLSSYPHPWLMPEFWQFPTVSMGLGPMQAIYQARFLKYLQNRGLLDTQNRKVWMFCGDGEMDEPESLGALCIAAREKLDNLIFVINCNLQRLDGPVRGNGKIVQELEGVFRGSGWNVIKVLWGSAWDPLFKKDKQGLLSQLMMETLDGEYQNYRAKDGAYIREHFFAKYPELKTLVAEMSDEELWLLKRGGHDIKKVYAAYKSAVQHKDQPTVILAKTIKGYGMGTAGEGQNITHQQKKMTYDQLRAFRDRFQLSLSDRDIENLSFYCPDEKSPEISYLKEQRKKLGGYLPARRTQAEESLNIPPLNDFKKILDGSNGREISTTMVFVELLRHLLKEKTLGPRIVPIVPDESRTFGMEGLFRQIGIYSPVGQLYDPVDAGQLMYYREDKKGQLLEEGINEGGAFCSWMAAATSYSTNNLMMVPFYIYYSMFGYQRVGDFVWAAGDMQARGFILGATAGRTTLVGEGLQHQDGHNLLFFSVVPNCVAYDPCFGYELAVIIQDGLHRMMNNQENVFYYLTVMNENYVHPPFNEKHKKGIIKGMYLLSETKPSKRHVQLLGSGTLLNEVIAAKELLKTDFDVTADVWSVTSFSELRKEALHAERYNMLHPNEPEKKSYVAHCLQDRIGPVIAASDYIRLNADQIREFIKAPYRVLGTDGYGRSDTREQLRQFFEVNRYYIVIACLYSLLTENLVTKIEIEHAFKKYHIDSTKPNPFTV